MAKICTSYESLTSPLSINFSYQRLDFRLMLLRIKRYWPIMNKFTLTLLTNCSNYYANLYGYGLSNYRLLQTFVN